MPKDDRNGKKKVDLSPDAVADALRAKQDLKDHPPIGRKEVVRFAGLLGDDDGDDKVRLYMDYHLNTYVLIDRVDILHRERVKNQSGIDVSLVFVRKDAVVVAQELSSHKVQADALSEVLIAAESGQFPAAGSEVATITPTTTIVTLVFCTNFTCGCTSRHSLLCSIICSDLCTFLCPVNVTTFLPRCK